MDSSKHSTAPTKAASPKKEKGPRDRKAKRKKIMKILLILFLVLGGLGIIGMVGVFAWFSRDLPDPDKILERNVALSTKIYDRTGEHVLYELHGDERRTLVSIGDIPDYVKEAAIVAEDKDFYKHHGFSITGIVRALFVNIFSGEKQQGGSTITQQFIKKAVLTSEKKYSRKIKELVLSYQIEKKFSKEQILQLYLNEIPYGSNAYGIEAASQLYFGKSVKDITIEEAALLAGVPKAPTHYSPYGSHTDQLVTRQQYIIDLMAENGYISPEEAELAKKEDILAKIAPRRESIEAPHFVFYLKELLTDKYGEKLVEQGGLKIISTLDYDKQKIAEEEVSKGVDKYVTPRGGSNAALVSIDTKTGQIIAMVGSKDYWDTKNDGNVNVTTSQRQPGSSFKPMVYLTAWQRGYTPETVLFDVETDFAVPGAKAYHPRNYDNREHGPLPMKKTLAGSLNIPAVKTLYLAGVNNVLDNAAKLGYTTLKDRDRYGLSLVLGGGEVTLLEHTFAYSILAREGHKASLSGILKVEDKDGKTLQEYEPHDEQVIDEKSVRKLNEVMSDDNNRSYVFGSHSPLTLPDRPVAAKTGTTNDYRDGWTLGFTPSIATGVWAGNNDNTPMNRGADGVVVAAPIWHNYMDRVLKGTPVENFRKSDPDRVDKPILKGEYDNKTKHRIDKITGKEIPEDCTTYPKEFIEEKEYKEVHTILHYVIKEDPRGPEPKDPTKDPQYQNWEAAVKKWAEGQKDYVTKDLEKEDCALRDEKNLPQVTISTPLNGDTLNETSFSIKASFSSTKSLKKVEYIIDGTTVDTKKTSPWQTSYKPKNLTNGFHKLTVRAYDSVENKGESQADFNYMAVGQTTTLYFNSPSQGATLDLSQETQTISYHAYHPGGLKNITLSFYRTEEGAHTATVIDSVTAPRGDTFTATWSTPSEEGEYSLFIRATDNSDVITQSDDLKVNIKAAKSKKNSAALFQRLLERK